MISSGPTEGSGRGLATLSCFIHNLLNTDFYSVVLCSCKRSSMYLSIKKKNYRTVYFSNEYYLWYFLSWYI